MKDGLAGGAPGKRPGVGMLLCPPASGDAGGEGASTARRRLAAAAALFIASVTALAVMSSSRSSTAADPAAAPGAALDGDVAVRETAPEAGVDGLRGSVAPPAASDEDAAAGILDEPEPTFDAGEPVATVDLTSPKAQAAEAKTEAELDKLSCKSRRKEQPGLEKGPRLVYLHIPKTGGTSIQAALGRWVMGTNGRAVLKLANGPAFGHSSFTCPPKTLAATVLVGHRGFGYCRDVEYNPRGMFVFTALREPVSRIVSLHDYNLLTLTTSPSNKATWEGSFKQESSLNEIVKKFNRTEEVESGESLLRYAGSQQTRFLCGYECLGPNVRGNESFTDDFMLERAKKNLMRIDAMGVTERLNELITVLRLHLQFVPKGYHKWPEANTQPARRKSKLDPEARAILEHWARADRELYRLADQLAKKHYAEAKRCLTKIGDSDAKEEVAASSGAAAAATKAGKKGAKGAAGAVGDDDGDA